MAGGRPTLYNPELAKRICKLISSSTDGINTLCAKHEWMPVKDTIYDWDDDIEEFSSMFDAAKRKQVDRMAQELIPISEEHTLRMTQHGECVDAGSVAVTRNKMQAIMYCAERLCRKKWSAQEKTVDDLTAANAQLAELVAKLSKDYKSDV